MPGALWRTDETVVLIYFQSRKVCHEACRKLIENKCGTRRDLAGVRGKLASVRSAFPELWNTNTQQWNLGLVDQWLLEQDAANFSFLMRFEPADQQIVSEFQALTPVLDAVLAPSALHDNGNVE